MAVNATRTDEQVQTVSKRKTLARMFYYLLAYKKQVVAVLTIMLVSVVITLINPLKYLIHRKIRPGYLIHIFPSLVFMIDTDPLDRKYFLHIRNLSKPPLDLHFLNPFQLDLL